MSGSGYGSGPVPPGAFAPPREPFELGKYRLAPWGSRGGAFVIDTLIILVVGGALIAALLLAIPAIGDSNGGIVALILFGLLGAAVYCIAAALVAPIFMAKWNGQTLGKRAFGIRVIKVNGEPMDLASAFVRESIVKWLLHIVVGMITFAILPLLDYLWPLWDDEKRALHDFLCETRVVEA